MSASPLDDALVGQLERSGFVADTRDGRCWRFRAEVETCRYLTFRAEASGEGLIHVLEVEEWRGGEGYEDEVWRGGEAGEAGAAIERWVGWASEPFEVTAWRRLLNRLGLGWID